MADMADAASVDEDTAALPAKSVFVAYCGRVLRRTWLRAPEFWLAVALAAFLRLWHIDLAQFLDDQQRLMTLARDAWLRGALPITGIPSSIGTLNPPLSIYLLAPFALFGKNPLPATIATALWNVCGVAFCYIFARRYFGRIVATSAALLFASCGSAVYYSRFIWQQNWLPPLIALWLLTLYLGAVSGRRGWFAPHVALLTAAILLHPSAALLLPVSLVGFALTPRRALPSRWEWAVAIGLVALLLAPSLVWEAISSGSDIHLFAHYLRHGGVFNLDVLGLLANLLGAPPSGDLGPGSLYAQASASGWTGIVHRAMLLCFAAGLAVLVGRLARLSLHIVRGATAGSISPRQGAAALWRGLRADPAWRAYLLLGLSVIVPLILLLRHSSDLYIHYLFILYPAVFIIAGLAVQALWRLPGERLSHLATLRPVIRRCAPTAVLLLLLALVVGQATQSALYAATLASGSFNAVTDFGYPLAEMQRLDAELGALQRTQRAHAVFISFPQNYRLKPAFDYLLVSEQADRVGFSPNCLVLPAPDEMPALVVATQPPGPANTLLAQLPGLSAGHLPLAGGDDLLVYQIRSALALLPGERAISPSPVTFRDAAGNGLRLDTIAFQGGLIRLRWTVVGPATNDENTPQYRIAPADQAANGATRALSLTDCQATRWRPGETAFTWISAGAATAQTVLLRVYAGPSQPVQPSIGPLRLLAGDPEAPPQTLLRPSSSGATSDGALVIPLAHAP